MDKNPRGSEIIGWLGPIFLLNLFIWFLFTDEKASSALCGPAENNCLREWLGALSGWAAFAAAAVTAVILQRQISLMREHQIQTLQVQLFQPLSVAKLVSRLAKSGEQECKEFSVELFKNRLFVLGANGDWWLRALTDGYLIINNGIIEKLSDGSFQDFEKQFGRINSWKSRKQILDDLAAISSTLSDVKAEISQQASVSPSQKIANSTSSKFNISVARLRIAISNAEDYLSAAAKASDEFIRTMGGISSNQPS